MIKPVRKFLRLRSNCALEAWRHFRAETAEHMCVRFSRRSRLQAFFSHPLMLPVQGVGVVMQWTCWAGVNIGEILRTGRWYHYSWIENGQHWEFVKWVDGPDTETHFIPPLFFTGHVRKFKPTEDEEQQ